MKIYHSVSRETVWVSRNLPVPRNLPKSSLNPPNWHEKSMWPKKAKKIQIAFGLFSFLKKVQSIEKRPNITNLASKKANWQPWVGEEIAQFQEAEAMGKGTGAPGWDRSRAYFCNRNRPEMITMLEWTPAGVCILGWSRSRSQLFRFDPEQELEPESTLRSVQEQIKIFKGPNSCNDACCCQTDWN